jgi:alkylation response protein AidB-like acyl-CoA dehydrogenase
VRLSDNRAEARFRSELVAWLDEHEPAGERASDPPRSSGHIPDWAAEWQRSLFDAGWLVPRWPPELGGREATAIEQMIYLEEMSHRRLPRSTNPQGLDVCAPTLADHGAGAQRDEWVPATLHGAMSWCVSVGDVDQGGRSADDEDGGGAPPGVALHEIDGSLVLRGSMPAPAGAADADRCLCAVAAGPAFDGVAVVAVDLHASGVVRPETLDGPGRMLAGDGTLSFDAVGVDHGDIVGARDQGWSVLQSMRARMRSMGWITSLLGTRRAIESLAEAGRSRGLAEDGVFRDTLAGLHVEAESVRSLAYRALAKQTTDRPNPELAMLPLVTAQVEERVYLAGLEALGADGLDRGIDGPRGWPSGSWSEEWAAAMVERSAFGGLGIERDRVAARVVGLPLR